MFTQVDLNDLVPEILNELNGKVEEKNIKVVLDKLPVLCANAVLMRQLFLNLLENAAKYTSKINSPEIHIYSEVFIVKKKMAEKLTDIKYGRIFIQDNGIGFDQKYAEEIFDMFRRLHPNIEYDGTGIGLALCKKIVEKNNGFISAKSEINKGSTFMISLPIEHTV